MKMLLAALLFLLGGTAAFAHALPGTSASLDFGRSDVGLELVMPLDQFELGFKHPMTDAPEMALARYRTELPAYLEAHVRPVAPDGRLWRVAVDSLRLVPGDGAEHADLVAHLTLIPPPGAPLRRFRFDYSVINHEVMTHTVLVFARSDWNNGVFGSQPELLGAIRFTTTGIDIDRTQGSYWQGFVGVFQLGMHHIAEGTDHLLFLLVLLLPAPLVRQGARRWGGFIGTRATFVRLAKLVTAFTLGHSLSLVAGAYGAASLPSQPVEVLIALSILIGAVHAWKPILRGREVWVAAAFGLVHGLAFAQVLAGGGLEGWDKAAAVLGFNLGIEAVQLLVVLLVAPVLIVLARLGRYDMVRLGGAAFAALAALAWAWERMSGAPNALTLLLASPLIVPLFVLVLAIAGLVSWAQRARPTAAN